MTLLLFGCGDDGEKTFSAPTNLRVDAIAEDRVDLSWEDRSENEAGFEVERAMQGEAFRLLGRTMAEATSLTDDTVVLGAAYTYRVRAVGGNKRSAYSNVVHAEIIVDRETAPPAPRNLQAADVTATTLALTWMDSSNNETAFEIERSLDTDFVDADTLAADMNETRYEENQLTPETQYYYRIRAINAVGASEYSQVLAVQTTPLPLSPPQPPSELSAQGISPSRITLAWRDNSDNEDGFIIMGSADGVTFEQQQVTAANVHTFDHTGLLPATTYSYKVLAFNTAGQSQESAVVRAETQAEALTPPAAPGELAYSELTSNAVKISWADRSDNEEGFRLERSRTSDFLLVDPVVVDPNVTAYQDINLLPSTDYYYRVVAFNQDGDSDYSDPVQLRTPAEVVPLPAPTALRLHEATASTITLVWQDNSEGEEGFNVEASTDGGETFAPIATTSANQTTYSHSGLAPQTTVQYRVNAYLGQRVSEYGNTLEVTTDPMPVVVPEAPSVLEATSVRHDRIALSWQDNSDNEAGFILERAEDEVFTDPTIMDLAAELTDYVDTGLTSESTYYYRIRAYNDAGDSADEGPVSATTSEAPAFTETYIADYTIAKESVLRRIPQGAITAAKEDLKIMYCGTSHSSQVVDGMYGLMHYKPGDDDLFHVTFGGTKVDGALDMHYRPSGVYSTAQDLSHDAVDTAGHTAYFRETVTYLDTHTDCNVVMWSWCAIGGHNVEIYLENFAELIAMYEAGGSKGRTTDNAVTFVFMTGYAFGGDGDTPEPPYSETPYQNYKRIRDYCEAHGYFCLDYWTQDTYNYGDDSYKPTENGNTNAQHLAWVDDPAHSLGTHWFNCLLWNSSPPTVHVPFHANQHLTGNRRAYAAWWIFARIAGWNGALE